MKKSAYNGPEYPTEAHGSIPAFNSYEEEANFWDTHSITDFTEENGGNLLVPFQPFRTLQHLNQNHLSNTPHPRHSRPPHGYPGITHQRLLRPAGKRTPLISSTHGRSCRLCCFDRSPPQ